MYDDIVIPTDGSIGAERGVDHGIELAANLDADVHALYVIDERVYGETPAMSAGELRFEKLEEQAQRAVDDVTGRAAERGLDAEGAVTRGTPSDEIVDFAEDRDADLIVMGIHGEDDVGTPHVGHVTNRVMRTIDIPVLPV